MNIGVVTSGFFHLLFGILLLINIENSTLQRREVIESVKVALISETDFTKKISENEITKSKPLEIEKEKIVKPESEKKQPDVIEKSKVKPVGNELVGLTEPNIRKVQKRKTPGEIITGIAQRGEKETNESENIQANTKNSKSPEKREFEKKKKKSSPTTTVISPEGINTNIVSGSLKIAKIPINKPKSLGKLNPTKMDKEPNVSKIYDQLVKEVAKNNLLQNKEDNESPIQNLAKARMLKKLNSNWNVVSINRLPNFEKYVIILEISLNSKGNIKGTIKTVYPKSLEGNFLIAERSAINAVRESLPFQVPKEVFPNGLILRVVFDPTTNIGAKNG